MQKSVLKFGLQERQHPGWQEPKEVARRKHEQLAISECVRAASLRAVECIGCAADTGHRRVLIPRPVVEVILSTLIVSAVLFAMWLIPTAMHSAGPP